MHKQSRTECHSAGEATPLPGTLRAAFERAFRADLSEVRIHVGPAADRAARALGADAFACGSAIVFRSAAYRPNDREGIALLAHEVAHLVQQARDGASTGGWSLSTPGDALEREADRWAARVIAGRAARGPRAAWLRVTPAPSGRIQRHVSYEHRMLGDGKTPDLVAIATNGRSRGEILANQIQLLDLWQNNPERVTEADIEKLCPWIRTVRVGPDRVLATYGELNALPDYLANQVAIDSLGSDILIGILQVIRQEGYNQLNVLAGQGNPNRTFAKAASSPWKLGLINSIVETTALDEFTFGLGPRGQDHYQGLLARNACHFAPFSWYRWQAAHLIARDLAKRAHDENNPELKRQAWIADGYADHFLQDSFAAGHLVNKTVVMQWFIEWAASQPLLPVADWDAIKDMTVDKQPGLRGLALYDPGYSGASCDPQTAQEAAGLVERITASAITGEGMPGKLAAYRKYLTFITSAAAQLSSANIHDHYNKNSLWVSSVYQPKAFEVWGDDTLFTGKNGGDGVQQTSETSKLSQQAIAELIGTGRTSITTEMIRQRFPTRAGTSADEQQDLAKWATETQKEFCIRQTFPVFVNSLKQLLVTLGSPRLGIVSRDQEFASVWARGMSTQLYYQVEMLSANGRLFAGSGGNVHELDPVSGRILWKLELGSRIGVGDYRMDLAFDGTNLFAAAHGYVYGVDPTTREVRWTAGVGNTGYHPVSVRYRDGSLFVGCNGYVYELDPANGEQRHSLRLGAIIGPGDYTTRIEVTDDAVYAGTHGYVYRITRTDWSKYAWSAGVGHTGHNLPNLLLVGSHLYVGCNGYAHDIDPDSGKVEHSLLLTGSIGVGNYETRLTYDNGALYAGVHGHVYRVDVGGSWKEPEWYLAVDGLKYDPVRVQAAHGRIFAASNGSVYEVDPAGTFRHKLLLTYLFGIGDYETSLVVTGATLYAGTHGYAYSVSVGSDAILADHLRAADLPSPRYYAAGAASADHVYLAGGGTKGPNERDVPQTFVRMSADAALSGSAGSWEILANLPTPRWGACAAVNGGSVFVIGGMSEPGDFNATTEAYDIAAGRWSELPAMPTPRVCAAAVAANDLVFVCGGNQRLGQGAGPGVANEVYSTTNKTWTRLPDMAKPVGRHGAVLLDGKIYAVGGDGDDQVYDVAARTWTVLPRQWPGRTGGMNPNRAGSVVGVGPRIYLFGAYFTMGTYSPTVWCLDTLDGTWSTVEDADVFHAAGAAGSGALPLPGGGFAVVVAGGATTGVNSPPNASAETYVFE